MSRRVSVALAVLAACGGSGATTPPPVVVQPVAPPKAPLPPACIATPEAAAAITRARAEGERVEFCVGAATDQCFGVELSSGTFTRLAQPATPAAPAGARIETTQPEVKVCTGDACTVLTQKVFAATGSMRAATNPDGSIAVVLLGDARAGKGYAEIWDVPKTRKLTTFRYARGDFRCGDVRLLGETIYLTAATCNEPGARGVLYSTRGRRIANVGGKDFGTYGNAHVQLDGPRWAFLEENGGQIAIQDIVKGKVSKVIELGVLWKNGGTAMGNPGESTLVRVATDKLAVIAGAPATGSVAVVNVASGEIEIIPAPPCTP